MGIAGVYLKVAQTTMIFILVGGSIIQGPPSFYTVDAVLLSIVSASQHSSVLLSCIVPLIDCIKRLINCINRLIMALND